jgi:subtilisin family serine protease
MRRAITSIVSLLLLIAVHGHGNGLAHANPHPNPSFVPGEILVKFREGVPPRAKEEAHLPLDASLINVFPSIGIQHLRLPPSISVEEALRWYQGNPDVEYVEPNYVIFACQVFPNDPPFDPQNPNYGILWGLHNLGQAVETKSGLPRADINAADAWEISTGGEEVIVAVIDTGVAYSHPDLARNMWTNPGEDPWTEPNDPTTGNGLGLR